MTRQVGKGVSVRGPAEQGWCTQAWSQEDWLIKGLFISPFIKVCAGSHKGSGDPWDCTDPRQEGERRQQFPEADSWVERAALKAAGTLRQGHTQATGAPRGKHQ